MRRRLPLEILVVGFGVLVAIGAWKMLSERGRAGVRDSLMASHQAFAAKLRSPASHLPEVRELSVPKVRQGETLLALASAEDSTFVAVTTTRRVLCLLSANEQWVEWQLPRAIERVAALHADAGTGKAHVVVGDDGTLLTADCRAPGSALVETARATGTAGGTTERSASGTAAGPVSQSVVAWLDAEEHMAWVAPASPAGPEVTLIGQPLPGASGEPITLQAAFPGEANTLFPNAAVIHSMARVGENLLLFYGDASQSHDADLRDESVLVISIHNPGRQSNRLVFAATPEDGEGKPKRWRSTHVRRVLPASISGRVYAMTEAPRGVVVLGSDAKPIDVQADALFATEYLEGHETYDLSVKSSGKGAAIEVILRGTENRLSYEIPWRYDRPAALAAISGEGRQIMIASEAGDLLLIDLSGV